ARVHIAALPTGASTGRASIEAERGIDRANLLVDRLHFRAAAESAAGATTRAACTTTAAARTISTAGTTASTLTAVRAVLRRVTARAPIAAAGIEAAVAPGVATTISAAEAGRTERLHLRSEILELFLLFRVCLE